MLIAIHCLIGLIFCACIVDGYIVTAPWFSVCIKKKLLAIKSWAFKSYCCSEAGMKPSHMHDEALKKKLAHAPADLQFHRWSIPLHSMRCPSPSINAILIVIKSVERNLRKHKSRKRIQIQLIKMKLFESQHHTWFCVLASMKWNYEFHVWYMAWVNRHSCDDERKPNAFYFDSNESDKIQKSINMAGLLT